MIKRLFWLTVGFLAGVGSSFALARRVRRAAARYAPPEVVDRWNRRARTAAGDVRAAIVEGRDAMRVREAELRSGLEQPRAPRRIREVGQ